MPIFKKTKFKDNNTGKEVTLDVGVEGQNVENGGNIINQFSPAGTRVNIASGEKQSVTFGKIAKWFADMKGAAFYGVANNGTTTEPGYLLDARQANPDIEGTLANQVSKINSNLVIDYSQTSLPQDTDINTLLQNVANRLYPKRIDIIKSGRLIEAMSSAGATYSEGAEYFTYTRTSATNYLQSVNKIDLTPFSALKIDFVHKSQNINTNIFAGTYDNAIKLATSGLNQTTRSILSLDITSIKSSEHIGCFIGSTVGAIAIYNMWLE